MRAGSSSRRTWSCGQPLGVGVLGRQLGLDLLVLDDAALGRVDQEHAARLQAALAHDALGRDVEDADLAGQDDEAVVGDPVAGRAQPVAVEHGADDRAVGEDDRGRAVPRLHERRVVAVEGPPGRGPWWCGSPTPRGSSSARRAAASARRGAAARAPRRSWPSRSPPACRSGRSATRSPSISDVCEQRLAGPHPVAVARPAC